MIGYAVYMEDREEYVFVACSIALAVKFARVLCMVYPSFTFTCYYVRDSHFFYQWEMKNGKLFQG